MQHTDQYTENRQWTCPGLNLHSRSSSLSCLLLLSDLTDSTVQNVLISAVGPHAPAHPPLRIKNVTTTQCCLHPSVPFLISLFDNSDGEHLQVASVISRSSLCFCNLGFWNHFPEKRCYSLINNLFLLHH